MLLKISHKFCNAFEMLCKWVTIDSFCFWNAFERSQNFLKTFLIAGWAQHRQLWHNPNQEENRRRQRRLILYICAFALAGKWKWELKVKVIWKTGNKSELSIGTVESKNENWQIGNVIQRGGSCHWNERRMCDENFCDATRTNHTENESKLFGK